ncbi:Retrovirus-related Pol polyprotein from type-1 retrotransposable element R1 [Nymphon striatum]|nr:Retrovirus-related Pol polyprotein from type-1 retrotransposable element R1 [Nymphon striatum]
MSDFETDFENSEKDDLEVIPYQYETVLQAGTGEDIFELTCHPRGKAIEASRNYNHLMSLLYKLELQQILQLNLRALRIFEDGRGDSDEEMQDGRLGNVECSLLSFKEFWSKYICANSLISLECEAQKTCWALVQTCRVASVRNTSRGGATFISYTAAKNEDQTLKPLSLIYAFSTPFIPLPLTHLLAKRIEIKKNVANTSAEALPVVLIMSQIDSLLAVMWELGQWLKALRSRARYQFSIHSLSQAATTRFSSSAHNRFENFDLFLQFCMVDSIMVEIASLRSHLEDAKGQLVKLISKDRIHKPDTVKFLNKSMKVALAKLSNIEKSVSEGATVVKERPSQPTYANVVAKAVASHRSPPETIIVESQDADIKTAGQLQALVKDSVNLREAKIGVTNIRHAGTKLIIKTQNSVDKGTLVNLINNTLKAKVKVWAPQKWRPNILVKNVPEDVKDDDIVDSILDQNNLVREDDSCIKKRFSFKSARGCRHVVLDVSPGMFKTLNSLGRVLVGWTSCRLEKFISVKKCTACFGYGHSKKEWQLNLHTSKVGTAALIKKAEELSIDVLLLQEIYTLNDKTAGFPLKCRVAEHNKNNGRIKACIVILNDNLNCQFDKSHSSENICIVNILTNNKPITLISAYTEPRSDLQEFLTELDQILQVVGTQRCILAMDTNSHSLAWGSDKTDSRGRSVEMLLGGHNMFIVNNGCTPTFNNVRSTSFIDVTVAGSDIYPKVSDWSTHGIFPGCDHEFISYVIDRPSLHNTFRSTRIYASHRIPKSKFIIKVKEQFKIKGLCPSVFSCVDSSTKLNNLVQQFSDCISTACNRQLTKKDKTSCKLGNPWWSKDLSIKHNEVQAARRRYQKTKTSVLRNLRAAQYKKLLSKFKKSVQHAKRVSWRAFCSQVSRTNPFSDAYKLCRSEFRRKHLDEPLLDSNGHRYADVAEECKALMNYHLGDEDGIQPETIVTPEVKNFKYLGLIIDDHLTWNKHIIMNTNRVIQFMFLFRRISRNTWGASGGAVKRIYKAALIPMLTYNCQVWAEALKLKYNVKILKRTQRQIAMAVLKSYRDISYAAAIALAGLVPLEIEIKRIARIFDCIGNNTLAVNNINYDLDLRVPVDKIVHPSLSPPTWVNSHLKPITTQLNVKNLPLKIPHPLSMENKFLIIHKLIYTDGSKVPEVGVGAAFTLTSENYFRDKKLRLANHCNIFQAEMVAILQSLKTLYLLETMNENILIVTDSLSSILAIQNFDNRHRLVNSVIKYVDKLDMNNCKIYLEWVKSHSGNALNDKVDLLAKQAVSINYSKTFSRVPIDFIKSQIGIEARKEYHQWYSSLDNNLRIKTLFPKLRDLTSFIGSYEIGFIESQVITGHGHLKEYLHRRHVTVDPYCECDSVSIQNADHLLFACSTYRSISSPLINKLNRYKIPLAVQQVIKTKLAGLLFKTFRKIYEEMLQLQS